MVLMVSELWKGYPTEHAHGNASVGSNKWPFCVSMLLGQGFQASAY